MQTRKTYASLSGIVLAALIAAAAPARAGTFEGTVKQVSLVIPSASLRPAVKELSPNEIFEISDERLAELAHAPGSGAQITESDIKVKGSKFRVDLTINGQPGFMLVDSASDTTWLVAPASRSYVEWTAADSATAKKVMGDRGAEAPRGPDEKQSAGPGKQTPAAPQATAAPTAAPSLTKLDQVAVVNDAQSRAFELREGDVISRGWVTDAYPELLTALLAASEIQRHRRSTALTPMERFAVVGLPMKVQTLRGDHYEEIDLVEIKAEPVPDDLMKVPGEFTRVDPNATKAPTPAPTPKAP